MTKKIFLIFLIIVLVFTTSSCWNSRELNEIAIVTGVGIDPTDNEGEYSYIFQIVNPSAYGGSGAGSTMTPTIMIKSNAPTVFEAIRKASTETSRRLYFGHLQSFLISSSIAEKDGIKDFLDLFYRDHEIRENIDVIISQDISTEIILSSQSVLEKNAGVLIDKKIDNTYKNSSFSVPIELRKVIATLMEPSSSAIIPAINLFPPISRDNLDVTKKADQPSIIKSVGLAVFKRDKLVGYLNNYETRALNWVTDNIKKGIIVVEFRGKNSLEILSSKTNISSTFKNGQPTITIDVKMNLNIGELNSPIDVTKVEELEKLEVKTNEKVNKEIKHVIDKAQNEFKLDFLSFNEEIKKHHPKEWKKMKDNWEEEFQNIKVDIKVNSTIKHLGTKNKSYQNKMEGK